VPTRETRQISPRGADFELPAGWSVERNRDFLLIQDPDKELKLWMVDIEGLAGAEAIASAWKLAVPGFSRNPDDTVSPPITEGWDSITRISYEVAAGESRGIAALSRTRDEIAYVLLIDGSLPALRRRGAQLTQIIGSQWVAGMKAESFAGKQAKPLDEAVAAALDTFIEGARGKSRVPGVAVAVVQGGRVVFERGYGTRRLGGAEKVTPDTAFLIGSTTKPLTSLMMAALVERGFFSWSTPVRDVLPAFRLADPELAGKVEMQHSVCACTGMPRQDMEMIFQFNDVSPEARLAELAAVIPTTTFGETFQYSNALVSAGGFAAAHARWPDKPLMEAYAETMRETLFEPMGMGSTSFIGRGAVPGSHAHPHGLHVNGDYEEIPLAYEDWVVSFAPAGGAWSTARDLARYLQLELAKGRLPDGRVLISESGLLERRTPRIKIGARSAYGLALAVSDGADLRSVSHGGGTSGFSALMIFWPDHDLGLVILSNAQAAHAFAGAIQQKLLELVFDIGGKADQALLHYLKRREERIGKELARLDFTPEPAWISPLLGVYENESLGFLALRRQGNRYLVDVGEWQSEVARYTHAGQSTLMLVGPPVAALQLQVKDEGNLVLEAGQQKYVFRRKN
jgi:CubicO group peptidase (beta-lactamase class C family)